MAVHKKARVFVANTTFATDSASVIAGQTRVREGHPLLKSYPQWFEPVDDAPVHYEVEAASQAPGEVRGDQ